MLEFLFKAFVVLVGAMFAGGFGVLLYGVCLGLKKERSKDKEAKKPIDPLENLHRNHFNCKCEPLEQRGKIQFTLNGVKNPVIVEAFFRKFDEAAIATSHCEEFYNGTVNLSFEVTGCAISDNLKRDFAKAGFCITDSK